MKFCFPKLYEFSVGLYNLMCIEGGSTFSPPCFNHFELADLKKAIPSKRLVRSIFSGR